MLLASLVAMPAAGAVDPTITVTETLNASTHLKTLNQTVQIPPGTFTATIDLVTGDLTGDIVLPPGTFVLKELGIPLATATMAVQPTKPVTGHVDLSTFAVTATSTFNIKVTRAAPALTPSLNLVGNNCTTSTPVSVTMTGTANLAGASTFSGTYTIPPFENCQLLTPALRLLVSGPGNTFNATATPQT
jgi:hypothetical protein